MLSCTCCWSEQKQKYKAPETDEGTEAANSCAHDLRAEPSDSLPQYASTSHCSRIHIPGLNFFCQGRWDLKREVGGLSERWSLMVRTSKWKRPNSLFPVTWLALLPHLCLGIVLAWCLQSAWTHPTTHLGCNTEPSKQPHHELMHRLSPDSTG